MDKFIRLFAFAASEAAILLESLPDFKAEQQI